MRVLHLCYSLPPQDEIFLAICEINPKVYEVQTCCFSSAFQWFFEGHRGMKLVKETPFSLAERTAHFSYYQTITQRATYFFPLVI